MGVDNTNQTPLSRNLQSGVWGDGQQTDLPINKWILDGSRGRENNKTAPMVKGDHTDRAGRDSSSEDLTSAPRFELQEGTPRGWRKWAFYTKWMASPKAWGGNMVNSRIRKGATLLWRPWKNFEFHSNGMPLKGPKERSYVMWFMVLWGLFFLFFCLFRAAPMV